MIVAQIIADSRAPSGARMTTFLLTYPRYILAELNTHRAFSRNSASSRAIPIGKMIRDVLRNPAKPVSWGQNGKGMQAKAELPKHKQVACNAVWVLACWFACGFSWVLSKLGAHKQLANRLTEPFAHMTTLVTATDFENFFALRAHPDAQPEFQALAFEMLKAYLTSTPVELKAGEWHLPFWRAEDEVSLRAAFPGLSDSEREQARLMVCTARAARTSYVNFFGKNDFDADIRLHNQLSGSGHWSPFEHCGRAEQEPVRRGNVVGYTQYRKLFPNECRRMTVGEAEQLLEARLAA